MRHLPIVAGALLTVAALTTAALMTSAMMTCVATTAASAQEAARKASGSKAEAKSPAADDGSGKESKDKPSDGKRGKRKKSPKEIPPVEPPTEEPNQANPRPTPATPFPATPVKPATPEEEAKAFREKFAWSKASFELPPDFAALPFDPPASQKNSLESDAPGYGVPREINELRKKPPAPAAKILGTISAGKEKEDVTALSLSADGSVLAVGTNKGRISVWNVAARTKRCDLERTEKGAANNAPVRALAPTPDGRHVVVGTAAPHVRVFDAETGKLAFRHEFFQANVQDVAVAHDGKWLFAIDGKGRLGGYPLLGGKGFAIDDAIAKPNGLYLAAPRKGKSLAFGSNSSKAVWTASLFEVTQRDGQPLGAMQPLESVSPTRVDVVAASSDQSTLLATTFNELTFVRHIPSPEGGGRTRTTTRAVGIHMPFCHRCALSPDDQYLFALSHSGWVEIRSTRFLGDATFVRLPGGGGKASAISDDARTFALDDGDGTITVSRIDDIPDGPHQRFAKALGGHLKRKDFARLDRLAERLTKQPEPFDWQPLTHPYDLFLTTLRGLASQATFEEWLAAKPESVASRLALVDLHYSTAWAQRGHGSADKVTEEGWKGFAEHMGKSSELLSGLKDGEHPPSVHRMRINMLQATGWDPDVVNGIEEKLLKDAPGYVPAHEVMALLQTARWYGQSDADAATYASRAADAAAKALGDGAGDEVYARIAGHLALFFKRDDLLKLTNLDYDRAQRGLASLTKRLPDEPLPRNQALRLAWAKQDRDTAARLLKEFDPVIHFRRAAWTYPQFKELRDWATK